MGGGRTQAARHRRGCRVRHRAEDRRLGSLARLRGWALRSRSDAWRRSARRGRHRKPAHDRGDTAADAGSGRARAADVLEVRGEIYFPLDGLRPLQRGAGRGWQEACAERAQRGRRLAPAAQPGGDGRATALDLRVRHRRASSGTAPRRSGRRSRGCGSAASARTRMPSGSSRSRRWRRRAQPGRRAATSSATRSTGS